MYYFYYTNTFWTSFGGAGQGAGALIANFGVTATASSITAGQGAGFSTWQKLKDFLGSPGANKIWHHIVEQCQTKATRAGFNVQWVQNSNNVINIPTSIHNQISAFYSSIPTAVNTNGMVFRDWLNTMSFEQQFAWGIWVLRLFGVKI